jgi:hypothetical protein
MPRIDGTDIKKRDHVVIFVNDAGFRLPVDNPTESAFQDHRFGHRIHNPDSVERQHERRAGRLADRQAAATICPVLVSSTRAKSRALICGQRPLTVSRTQLP